MSEKTLKSDDVEVSANHINLGDIDKIVIFNKFEHIDKGFKYFIGYREDNIIRLLCIILPQMSRYIKYFDSDGKNMSF